MCLRSTSIICMIWIIRDVSCEKFYICIVWFTNTQHNNLNPIWSSRPISMNSNSVLGKKHCQYPGIKLVVVGVQFWLRTICDWPMMKILFIYISFPTHVLVCSLKSTGNSYTSMTGYAVVCLVPAEAIGFWWLGIRATVFFASLFTFRLFNCFSLDGGDLEFLQKQQFTSIKSIIRFNFFLRFYFGVVVMNDVTR